MNKFRVTRIERPAWAQSRENEICGLTTEVYASIQALRERMLEVVQHEVDEYLNTPNLYGEGDSFPDRLRMTGNYYLARESYNIDREVGCILISIMCHFLERPTPYLPREDDYLGLEVWLKFIPGKRPAFEVFRNTDSSSI